MRNVTKNHRDLFVPFVLGIESLFPSLGPSVGRGVRRDRLKFFGGGNCDYVLYDSTIASRRRDGDRVTWTLDNCGHATRLTATRLREILREISHCLYRYSCHPAHTVWVGARNWFLVSRQDYPLVFDDRVIKSPVNVGSMVKTAIRIRDRFQFATVYLIITRVVPVVVENVSVPPSPRDMEALHLKSADMRVLDSLEGIYNDPRDLVIEGFLDKYEELRAAGKLPAWACVNE